MAPRRPSSTDQEGEYKRTIVEASIGIVDIKTEDQVAPREKPIRDLLTGWAMSGVKGASLIQAHLWNCRNPCCDDKGEGQVKKSKALSTDAQCGGGPACSGAKEPGCSSQRVCQLREKDERMTETKPFVISKALVWGAYQRVKANKGAAGIDGQTIESFASDEKKNLYRIWNRMSSGSYFPPAVKAVPIPKRS